MSYLYSYIAKLLRVYNIHYRRRKQRRNHAHQQRRNQETSYLVGRGDCYQDGNEMEELSYAYTGQENICEMIVDSLFCSITCLYL